MIWLIVGLLICFGQPMLGALVAIFALMVKS